MTEYQIDLTPEELRMIRLALVMKDMREFISTPSTPYIVRKIYKGLLEKLLKPKEKPRLIIP